MPTVSEQADTTSLRQQLLFRKRNNTIGNAADFPQMFATPNSLQ